MLRLPRHGDCQGKFVLRFLRVGPTNVSGLIKIGSSLLWLHVWPGDWRSVWDKTSSDNWACVHSRGWLSPFVPDIPLMQLLVQQSRCQWEEKRRRTQGDLWRGAGRSADTEREQTPVPVLLLFGLATAQIFKISLFTNKLLTVCFTAVMQRLIAVCEVLIALWEIGLHSSN